MATPILRAALESESFSRVSVILDGRLADLFEEDPVSESLCLVGDRSSEVDLLRDLAPDAVLLLTNSLGAAWRAFRARVPVRAGAALSGRRLLLTHAVVPPVRAGRRAPIPTAHLMRDVAGLLGIAPTDLHPRLEFGPGVSKRARLLLERAGVDPDEPYVLCAPGASFGAAKLWPPEHFARVLDTLYDERGWRAVVNGGPSEGPLLDAVAECARSPVVSLAPFERDLATSKPLAAWSRLVLVGDTGPRWFAAAFDVPCVTVMGPNFPELTASSLECCEVVRLDSLECAPCLRHRCPLGHHRCMRELAPEAVLEAAARLLDRKASSAPEA